MLIEEPFYNTGHRYGYYSPTRVIAHPESRSRALPLISRAQGYILVIDEVFAGKAFEDLFGGPGKRPVRTIVVRREPDLVHVETAAANRPQKADLVVALGGGSTIDFAKALSLMIGGYPMPPDENCFINTPTLLALPTTCGTGSETSRHCVLYGKDNRKFAIRHWSISPALALLDPFFLETSSHRVVAGSAFDAFMHHLEVFTLRFESSGFSRQTSAYWMRMILHECLKGIASTFSEESILELQKASAFGGIALSNHRTGLIHTCAESLASLVHLTHPLSLFVFFEAILKSYATWFDGEMERLGFRDITSRTIIDSWNQIFREIGYAVPKEDITPVDTGTLVELISRDTVIFKEYPVELNTSMIPAMCEESLQRFT